MILSTHYYVLSLSESTNRLYEAFRSNLIDIENTWFPLVSLKGSVDEQLSGIQLRTLLQEVDGHFGHYYEQEPLGMILTGTQRNQNTFASITRHGDMIIGRTAGDHSATSTDDLGHIAWAIVKRSMAGANNKWEREVEAARRREDLAVGIDAVSSAIATGTGTILLVEESYEAGPVPGGEQSEDDGDLVDIAVHGVLALGGQVVFLDDDALAQLGRIALILRRGAQEECLASARS